MTPPVALCVTSLLFGVAAVAAGLLPLLARGPDTPSPARALWPTFVGLLHTNKDMKRSFWGFVAFVSIYQGFFNVSRVTLPAHVLHLSESYVGLLQVVNSIAALIGAIVYYSTSRQGDRLAPLAMSITSAAFMITTASGFGVVSSYAAYFFYIFFFELAFFRLQADVVVNSPSQDMPLVASVQYAAVYAGMIATTFIGSILVERVGLMWTSVIFVGVYAAAIAVRPNVFRPAVQ
jgi:predicted MFS family arabinose efflux permease